MELLSPSGLATEVLIDLPEPRNTRSRQEKMMDVIYVDDGFFYQYIPGDQPELSKCMMLLLLKYKRNFVGDGLELKRIAERLLI